jgi:hypothetical protein
MMDTVIINGVRYVPAALPPDEVRFYFMHDNHVFTRLKGETLDDVLAHADAVEAGPRGSYGMLCPAILLRGGKECRRVGPAAHARGSKDPKDEWDAAKAAWRQAMEADPGVCRIMSIAKAEGK